MKYLVINTDTEETICEANTEQDALESATEINSSNRKNDDGSMMTAYITLA
jgi:hypothetical protein